jgi:pilus assembly protein CpaD
MIRPLLLAALAPAALVAGCSGTPNRGLESVHQPVVSRVDYAFDLDAAGGTLAGGEAARLDGWLRTMRLGYGDQVAIDTGRPDQEGTDTRVDPAADQIADVVARFGLLVSGPAPVTPAPLTPGTLRVVVSRMRAAVPGCPDWSRNITNDFEGHTHSNYGCASNANLAAMVANPADLVRGQEGASVTDAAAASKAIDTYRKATPTGAGQLKVDKAGSR